MANANNKGTDQPGSGSYNPRPIEWTRWHYEQAAEAITQRTMDKDNSTQLVKWLAQHLEKYGFYSVTFPVTMRKLVEQKFKQIENLEKFYGYELAEKGDDLKVFVYDLDLTHDEEGFALLRKACVDPLISL